MALETGETGWRPPAETLDERSLRAHIAGETPALRIADFASAEECASLCASISARASESRAAQTARMSLFGANFSKYAGQDKEGQFEQGEPSYRAVAAITAGAVSSPGAHVRAAAGDLAGRGRRGP